MISLDYVAGLFDGEGTIYYDKRCNRYIVRITNTNLEALQIVRDFLNMGRIYVDMRKGKKIYNLQIAKKSDVRRFIELMRNKCIIKRQRIEEYMRWLNNSQMSVNSVAEL